MLDAAAGLARRGHRATLLGRPGAPWLRRARALGLAVRDDHRGPWLARLLRVRAAMRAERADVVVVKAKKAARMAAFGRATGAGGRVALLFGLTHELDCRRWVDRFTWRTVDAGIVLAHAAARWYAAHGFGPPEKLHVLWKGVDLARFTVPDVEAQAARARLGLAPGEIAIGTVGRLAWQKGLDDLFASIRRLRGALPPARFFVIGDGRDRPLVEAAAADLGGAVTLLGQRDDVPQLLSAMDIVVQPSRREVMVQTTLEAMAAGRPVVSTNTAGADEAIEEGRSGLLVPVGDVSRLAERVAELAHDPERRALLGDGARRRIAEHFTLERMLDRCEGLFAGIAGAPPPLARGS
jgi:glycosyltransferase involved in cell wall biosynthesis